MKRIIIICLVILSLTVIGILTFQVKSKEISSNIDLPFSSIVKEKNHMCFYLEKNLDLHGQTIDLPPNSVINIKKGIISNGKIIGDSTKIVTDSYPIFDNVILEGSWKIKEIKTDLFKTIDSKTPSNLCTLLSDKYYNKLCINHTLSVPIKAWSSVFIIKSNTSVELNADIYSLPSTYKGGYCLYLVGNNIQINGNGHFLFGTLASSDQKECSEWLHGLCISKSSNNIEIKDLNSWLFCGDGFYNSGSNVTIKNVNSKFNGRQGLSIVSGENIKVIDSSFTYTGYYRIASGNGPGAGIDIEPSGNDKVNRILIDNCFIKHNYRYMNGFKNDLEIYNAFRCNVLVKNCEIGGVYLGDCSDITMSSCIGIETVYRLNNNISQLDMINCNKHIVFSKKDNP